MDFYDRYEQLCHEKGVSPQNKELMGIIGVSSGTISNWKKNHANPQKIEIILSLSRYFGVTTDYLFGLSEEKRRVSVLSADEERLLEKFNKLDDEGKELVQSTATIELRRVEKNEDRDERKSIG